MSATQKLYYVANARMPNEKAHGIQIAKMCEAFVLQGVDLVLVVPARGKDVSIQEFYGLSVEVKVVRVPTVDLYSVGRLGFALSSLLFLVGVSVYFFIKKIRGERVRVYTVDMDNFSYTPLVLLAPVFTEMHTPKVYSQLQNFFFSRAAGVIATNGLTRQKLIDDYKLAPSCVVAEPNGVDVGKFGVEISTSAAREVCGLPQDKKIVLYVGRFYAWKGLDILPLACGGLPEDTRCYMVGGSEEEFKQVTGVSSIPPTMVFVGEKAPQEIPLWLQAADVLLVLGTEKNEDSSRYTSPMKLFEYMAANKPIVASATAALTDVLTPASAFLCEPDNVRALSDAMQLALASEDAPKRSLQARQWVQVHTWNLRAERVLAFINSVDRLKSL